MAIYDNLPYTNFHELNADWLIKQANERKAKIEDFQRQLEDFQDDYNQLLRLAAALNISGSNVTVAGTLTAAALAGNLTGNVTGNAATATHATSADSATNATNATHATTAESATTATTATTANGLSGTASVNTTGTITASAFSGNLTGNVTGNLTGTATLTSNFTMRTDITSTDADDYMPSVNGMALFKTAEIATHYIPSLEQEYYVILAVKEGSHGVQFAYCPLGGTGIYYRTKFSTWTSWTQI